VTPRFMPSGSPRSSERRPSPHASASASERILKRGGVDAQDILERETDGCSWATGEVQILADPPVLHGNPGVCGRRTQWPTDPYCAKHNRELAASQEER
jgi:hypothetical protein